MLNRQSNLRWFLVLAIGFVLTTAQAIVVKDDRQIDVVIAKPPQRIVSLLPSLTETVCALGQCKKLVGVDRYSSWPDSINKLPRMGGGIDPSIESVVAAKPDLVLMGTSARGAERLADLGITVLTLEPRTHADVQRTMLTLGKALDIPEKDIAAVWTAIQTSLEATARSVPIEAKGKRVYFEVSPTPYGASESSFIGETLLRLGMQNILPGSLGPFPKINPEFVVRAQPDIIMVGDSNFVEMASRPGWKSMHAMRSQKICHFKKEDANILARPGPRLAEAAQLMAQCLIEKSVPAAKEKPVP
jgi:iron complex transport system substrate-binding protein